jgi:hypothetical protein
MASKGTVLASRVRHEKLASGNGNAKIQAIPPLAMAPLRKVRNGIYRLGARAPLRTLFLQLPLYRNPDTRGNRKPMESRLLEQTLAEIKNLFPGVTAYRVWGWCRSERPDGDSDLHMRFEVDVRIGRYQKQLLRNWKHVLNLRFDQGGGIFMRLSAPIQLL